MPLKTRRPKAPTPCSSTSSYLPVRTSACACLFDILSFSYRDSVLPLLSLMLQSFVGEIVSQPVVCAVTVRVAARTT